MSGRSKRAKARRGEESSDEEDGSDRMPYFVPEEGIDIEPLAGYVRGILDREARVRIGEHPQRRDQKGFWVESIVAISREDISAMIDDTRSWRREGKKGYYVNSETAKRRQKIGRAQAAKERPIAPMRGSRDEDHPPSAPQPITRASADNITMSDRTRQASVAAPSPRPASAQPVQQDPRRPSQQGYPASAGGGYNIQAQYTISANLPNAPQFAQYSGYDTAPPPYSSDDAKLTQRPRPGGTQPSTTGSQGFSMYATSPGTLPPQRPPQGGNQPSNTGTQGFRRQDR